MHPLKTMLREARAISSYALGVLRDGRELKRAAIIQKVFKAALQQQRAAAEDEKLSC